MSYICDEGTGDEFLNQFILSNGRIQECSYCEQLTRVLHQPG